MTTQYSNELRDSSKQDELIYNMTRANEIIQKAFSHYDQMDVNLIAAAVRKSKRTRKYSKLRPVFAIGAVLIYMVLLIIVVAIITHLFKMDADTSSAFGEKLAAPVLILLLVALIIGLILPSKLADMDKKYGELIQGAEKEKRRGDLVLKKNLADLDFLDEEYWYPIATETMLKYARQGRAKSLPELYEKFDEQLYRWKTEDAFEKLYNQQQAQINILNNIQTNTAFSAIANSYTAKILHDVYAKRR